MAFRKITTKRPAYSRISQLIRLKAVGKSKKNPRGWTRLSFPRSVIDRISAVYRKFNDVEPLDVFLDEDTLQLAIKFHPGGSQAFRRNGSSGYISTGALTDFVPDNTAFTWGIAEPDSGFDFILTPLTETVL